MAALPFRQEAMLEAALMSDRLTITTRIRAMGRAGADLRSGVGQRRVMPGREFTAVFSIAVRGGFIRKG
jgi:hypothetical protein